MGSKARGTKAEQEEQSEAKSEPGAEGVTVTSPAPVASPPPERKMLGLQDLIGPGRGLPFGEEELFDDQGTSAGVMLLQGLTQRELDAVNASGEEKRDEKTGEVTSPGDTRGEWDAKVTARAMRDPNTRRPVAGETSSPDRIGWLALAEKLYHTMPPGHLQQIRARVLKLSGYAGKGTRAEEKKGS